MLFKKVVSGITQDRVASWRQATPKRAPCCCSSFSPGRRITMQIITNKIAEKQLKTKLFKI